MEPPSSPQRRKISGGGSFFLRTFSQSIHLTSTRPSLHAPSNLNEWGLTPHQEERKIDDLIFALHSLMDAGNGTQSRQVLQFDRRELLRFLKARDFHVQAAAKMYAEMLLWREENGVDSLYRNYEFHERREFVKFYPQGYHGADRLGRPVYWSQPGKINPREVLKVTTPDRIIKAHIQQYEYLMREILPTCSRLAGHYIDQTCGVMDVAGVGLGQLTGEVKQVMQATTKVTQDAFPETNGFILIINAPVIFRVIFSLVKPLLSPRTLSKIEIVGSNYKPILLKHMDAHMIPGEYGGTSPRSITDNWGPWSEICEAERRFSPWDPRFKASLVERERAMLTSVQEETLTDVQVQAESQREEEKVKGLGLEMGEERVESVEGRLAPVMVGKPRISPLGPMLTVGEDQQWGQELSGPRTPPSDTGTVPVEGLTQPAPLPPAPSAAVTVDLTGLPAAVPRESTLADWSSIHPPPAGPIGAAGFGLHLTPVPPLSISSAADVQHIKPLLQRVRDVENDLRSQLLGTGVLQAAPELEDEARRLLTPLMENSSEGSGVEDRGPIIVRLKRLEDLVVLLSKSISRASSLASSRQPSLSQQISLNLPFKSATSQLVSSSITPTAGFTFDLQTPPAGPTGYTSSTPHLSPTSPSSCASPVTVLSAPGTHHIPSGTGIGIGKLPNVRPNYGNHSGMGTGTRESVKIGSGMGDRGSALQSTTSKEDFAHLLYDRAALPSARVRRRSDMRVDGVTVPETEGSNWWETLWGCFSIAFCCGPCGGRREVGESK